MNTFLTHQEVQASRIDFPSENTRFCENSYNEQVELSMYISEISQWNQETTWVE